MKRTFTTAVITLSLALLACTRPQPATTPADVKEAERSPERTTVTTTTPGEEQLQTEDQQDSEVTGYGEDPGEETQE